MEFMEFIEKWNFISVYKKEHQNLLINSNVKDCFLKD